MSATATADMVKSLATDLIRIDGGTQFRASVNEQKLAEYKEVFESAKGWPFDTVCEVFHDGVDYYLVDGFHRYFAARQAKRASISCRIHKGTLREAIRFALGANARHGLHRSNEDKRKAVAFALADSEWNKLSSRAIAEMCGVGHAFVNNMRSEASVVHGIQHSEKLIGKDGRSFNATKPKQEHVSVEETTVSEATVSTPESEWVDVDDTPEPVRASSVPASNSPEPLAANINAVGTRLDGIIKELEKLSDERGGEWIDLTEIRTQAATLKATIRSAAFWVYCPDCGGKGCQSCKHYGWLSRARKPFLTQSQKDKLGL